VRLRTQRLSGATVLSVTGELDASNIDHLTDCARPYVASGRSLILDLTKLDFLGAQGIRSLFAIADECRRGGIKWALVPSHSVSRLLRVCDTQARLPSATSINQALERVSAPARTGELLQLVTKSR
jgi:anti-anti-sigma factor